MATYGPASGDVQAMIDDLIEANHPDLVETGARIGAVFAYPTRNKFGIEKSPAVSQYGVKCLAKAKVVGEADRVLGEPDASITIDWPDWNEGEEPDRVGLIDRMLYSLVVRRKKGVIQTDDRGRPKLKVRKPDWLVSGFRAMAERHKEHSVEVIQARMLRDTYGNLLFGFAEDQAVRDEAAAGPRAPSGRSRGKAEKTEALA